MGRRRHYRPSIVASALGDNARRGCPVLELAQVGANSATIDRIDDVGEFVGTLPDRADRLAVRGCQRLPCQ